MALDTIFKLYEEENLHKTKGFSNFQLQPILLYGAGNLGKKLYKCLRNNDVFPVGFIDRKGPQQENDLAPVYFLDDPALDAFVGKTVVILAGLFGERQAKEIRDQLIKRGFISIYALHEINRTCLDMEDFFQSMFIGQYNIERDFCKDKEKIKTAYQLFKMADERLFFETYIKGYLMKDVTVFPMPLPLEQQYIEQDFLEKLNYTRFIDCGAFDGDTLRNLKKNGAVIKAYAAFEPQGDLCRHIYEEIIASKDIQVANIFPCGASDCFEKLRFAKQQEGQSAAKADAGGTDIIQCAAIDDVLYGFAPTFIKMDIEGMEIKALRGAEKTIKNYLPQLAICVYHDLSHLWEIPLLIKSFFPGYRFYLRNYQYMGLETVVYAFPDR